tara:strand:+ start:560 stop:1072 length:513 start_codon:yes stop_codon:yes gene_type:complete
MASKITASTLKVTIQEDIKLNGVQQGGTNTFNIGSVNEIYKRIVTCPASVNTVIATFKSNTSVTGSAGTTARATSLDMEDVKYIRVTNLDNSNSVNLSLQVDAGEDDGAADESVTLLLEAEKSFMMGSPNDGIDVNDTNADVLTTLEDLESILINPDSNAVDIEIFVASV